MARQKHRTPRKTWNRDIPDSVLCIHSTRSALDKAESLNPTPMTMDRFLVGVPEAQAIIDAYAFRFPVTAVRA